MIGLIALGLATVLGVAVLAISIYVAPEGKYGVHF